MRTALPSIDRTPGLLYRTHTAPNRREFSLMRKLVIAFTVTTAIATAAVSAYGAARPHARTAATAGHPQYGTFGFDLAGMDRNVAPGDSFYRFANGNWDRTTEI